ALKSSPTLHLTDAQIGASASLYLVGAVTGALVFGALADRFGRRRLFSVTLGLYLVATALTAFSHDFFSFALWRMLTGAGIGGEYSAINSAIQELIPARYRGRTDLIVNGSFWIGAALGAGGAVVLLAPGRLPPDWGWRCAFGIGAVLGLAILYLRRFMPESPRWLMTHGRVAEAELVLARIEGAAGVAAPDGTLTRIRLAPRRVGLVEVARTLLRTYPRRSIHVLVLMASQAFFYNAIFFTYALVLGRFFGVADDRIGLYILPFAAGNFLGPLLLGPAFDVIGRRPMIAITYAASGVLLAGTALLFVGGVLGATGMTVAWSVVFFFASAAASAAYLSAGESFPLEMRALAIAIFYAVGTALGGVAGPWLFGVLIGSGERGAIAWGYAFGALLMLVAAVVTLKLGVAAERRPLEDVARPLSSAS
ncbi:MAG TPA: MFS transporter, partial [Burkholderiaceae bacterium]|nr:MFS transporter [Burkholderiaceae bacterium]